jgi:hypothetical protein
VLFLCSGHISHIRPHTPKQPSRILLHTHFIGTMTYPIFPLLLKYKIVALLALVASTSAFAPAPFGARMSTACFQAYGKVCSELDFLLVVTSNTDTNLILAIPSLSSTTSCGTMRPRRKCTMIGTQLPLVLLRTSTLSRPSSETPQMRLDTTLVRPSTRIHCVETSTSHR